jgi:hypothetical protein
VTGGFLRAVWGGKAAPNSPFSFLVVFEHPEIIKFNADIF